jgi:hypothetical protein
LGRAGGGGGGIWLFIGLTALPVIAFLGFQSLPNPELNYNADNTNYHPLFKNYSGDFDSPTCRFPGEKSILHPIYVTIPVLHLICRHGLTNVIKLRLEFKVTKGTNIAHTHTHARAHILTAW